MKILTTLALLIPFCVCVIPQSTKAAETEVTLSEVYEPEGNQIHVISLQEANAMQIWDPATQKPPLNISDGIQAAKKWLQAKGFSDKAFLEDIELKTPLADGMQNRWFYIFSYDIPPQKPSGFPRCIRVVVLMNGKVVDTKGN